MNKGKKLKNLIKEISKIAGKRFEELADQSTKTQFVMILINVFEKMVNYTPEEIIGIINADIINIITLFKENNISAKEFYKHAENHLSNKSLDFLIEFCERFIEETNENN